MTGMNWEKVKREDRVRRWDETNPQPRRLPPKERPGSPRCAHAYGKWQNANRTDLRRRCSKCGKVQVDRGGRTRVTLTNEEMLRCSHAFGPWGNANATDLRRRCSKCGTVDVDLGGRTRRAE